MNVKEIAIGVATVIVALFIWHKFVKGMVGLDAYESYDDLDED